jgi:hypothetical protein
MAIYITCKGCNKKRGLQATKQVKGTSERSTLTSEPNLLILKEFSEEVLPWINRNIML